MTTEHCMVELPAAGVRRILGVAGLAEVMAAYEQACRFLERPPALVFAQTEYRGWIEPERRSIVNGDGSGTLYGLFRGEPNEIWLGIHGPRGVKLPKPVANLWHELAHAFEREFGLPADRNEGRCSRRAKRWEATPPSDGELASFAAERSGLAQVAPEPVVATPAPSQAKPERLAPLAQRGVWRGTPYVEVRSVGGLLHRGVEFYEIVGADGFIRPIFVSKVG